MTVVVNGSERYFRIGLLTDGLVTLADFFMIVSTSIGATISVVADNTNTVLRVN